MSVMSGLTSLLSIGGKLKDAVSLSWQREVQVQTAGYIESRPAVWRLLQTLNHEHADTWPVLVV